MTGLAPLFEPRSIAVIGASEKPGSIGNEVLRHLLEGGFRGTVVPVHPRAREIRGVRAIPSIEAAADDVELAVLSIPAESLLTTAEACGRRGVRALVVISAGFREAGDAGAEREAALLEIARRYGMRVLGPNCMGAVNSDPAIRLHASFARTRALPGPLSLATQSGAVGEVILEEAERLGLGFAQVASVGNASDISMADLLEHWSDEPRTEAVLLYLEGFGDARRFAAAARRLARRKPVFAIKAGGSDTGAAAALSHTGALAGGRAPGLALLRQCGIVPASSIPELLELSLAIANQPLPRGPRVAVITNAGGPGVLAIDALTALGLSPTRPVDLLAGATPERYCEELDRAFAAGAEAVIAIFVPPAMIDAEAVAREMHAASARHADRPLLGCFMGQTRRFPEIERECGRRVPLYRYPEEACRALGLLWRAASRARNSTTSTTRSIGAGGTRTPVTSEIRLSGSLRLVESYGIPVAEWRVGRAEALRELAREIGYPVVLKADVPAALHKSDLGLVQLGLRSAADLADALARMSKSDPGVVDYVIQRQVEPGLEAILGMQRDPALGPVLALGVGGLLAEVYRDVAIGLPPLTAQDLDEMIGELRGAALFRSFRGSAAIDRGALLEMLWGIERLAADHPEIAELDLNPVVAHPDGATTVAVDARIIVRAPTT